MDKNEMNDQSERKTDTGRSSGAKFEGMICTHYPR